MADLLAHPEVLAALIGGVFLLGSTALAVFKGGNLFRELRQRKIYSLRAELRRTCPHVNFEIIDTAEGKQEIARRMFFYAEGATTCECNFCGTIFLVEPAQRFLLSLADAPEDVLKPVREQLEKAKELRQKLESLGNWASA